MKTIKVGKGGLTGMGFAKELCGRVSDRSSIPLLGCPCCGSDNVRPDKDPELARIGYADSITCFQCGLTMLTRCGLGESKSRWNKRQPNDTYQSEERSKI